MRLGGPIYPQDLEPDAWAAAARGYGYRAANCPVKAEADDATVAAYARAAREADVVIAEVGAWSNPITPDDTARLQAIDYCQRQLALADRIGARCCVNIAGSRGVQWDGPAPDNLSPATFDLIVETVHAIIDAVRPTRTYYALETMPWVYPDSPESYERLIAAIDRPAFGVHLDPVNLISSPQRYYRNGDLIRDCFARLGPWVRSCHAKDILLSSKLTVHLDEVRPGLGALDYRAYLGALAGLPADTPLMLEHLSDEGEYLAAATHIRGVARELGIAL